MSEQSLLWSIKNGDIDQVKSCIDSKNTDINSTLDGRPLIHHAADYGQKEVLEYLISKGADINLKDKHGISALLAAIWEGHTTCVKVLLAKGASKMGTAPDGTSYVDSAEKEEIWNLLK